MKTCNKCNVQKDLNCFNKDLRNSDGLQGICVDCRRLAKQNLRAKNKILGPQTIIVEKTCNKCTKTKKVTEFYKDVGISDGYATICKKCKSIDVYEWRNANRERYNENQRKQHQKNYLRNRLYRYKLTPEQYTKMLVEQNNKCKLCECLPKNNNLLVIDHDHKTNKVRRLLCYGCNRAIAILENPELLGRALQYLKKS